MKYTFEQLYEEIIEKNSTAHLTKRRQIQTRHRNELIQLTRRDYREMMDLKDKQKIRRAEAQSKLRDELLQLTKKDYQENLELREKQNRRRADMIEKHRSQLQKFDSKRSTV